MVSSQYIKDVWQIIKRFFGRIRLQNMQIYPQDIKRRVENETFPYINNSPRKKKKNIQKGCKTNYLEQNEQSWIILISNFGEVFQFFLQFSA